MSHLKFGDKGADVEALQRGLIALGYAPPASDSGDFNLYTKASVERFQGDHELVADGIAGPLTLAELARRVPPEMPPASAFEFHTSGPTEPGAPELGWWYTRAQRVDAHPGRIGRAIKPWGVVVHTTDMMPHTFDALVKQWHETAGSGAAAHVIIGRDATQGVVQMVALDRNANHAGGHSHGNFVAGGAPVHPNLWTIGIELHAAGRLGKRPTDGWPVPDADVFIDSRGIGWHLVTSYQLTELERTLDTVTPALASVLTSVTIAPNGTYAENGVTGWAEAPAPWLVGHVSLDPRNKTDPGPQVMDWLHAYAAAHARL